MEEQVLKPIGFPLSMLQSIDKIAAQKRKSRAEIVRIAVSEYLEKEQNTQE